MGLNRCVGVRAERGSVDDHARTATRRLSNARDPNASTRLDRRVPNRRDRWARRAREGDDAAIPGRAVALTFAASHGGVSRSDTARRDVSRRVNLVVSSSKVALRGRKKISGSNRTKKKTSATCVFAEGTDETEAAARRPTGASDATDRAAHASRSLPGWTCSGLVDNARRRVRRAETRPPFPSRGHGVSRGCGHLARAAAAARQRGAYASSPPVDPDQPFLCARVIRGDEHARSRPVASALPRPGHARGYAIAQGDAGLGRVSRQLFFFGRVP